MQTLKPSALQLASKGFEAPQNKLGQKGLEVAKNGAASRKNSVSSAVLPGERAHVLAHVFRLLKWGNGACYETV